MNMTRKENDLAGRLSSNITILPHLVETLNDLL